MSMSWKAKILTLVLGLVSVAALAVLSGQYSRAEEETLDEKVQFGKLGSATVVSGDENICATELMGTWKTDAELSKRLGSLGEKARTTLVFEDSDESKKRILKALPAQLKLLRNQDNPETRLFANDVERAMQTIYLVGKLKRTYGHASMTFDFALSTVYGNPYLFIYDAERKKFEYGNIMVARDEEGDNDLLFVGGHSNNQSLLVFSRE